MRFPFISRPQPLNLKPVQESYFTTLTIKDQKRKWKSLYGVPFYSSPWARYKDFGQWQEEKKCASSGLNRHSSRRRSTKKHSRINVQYIWGSFPLVPEIAKTSIPKRWLVGLRYLGWTSGWRDMVFVFYVFTKNHTDLSSYLSDGFVSIL